MALSLKGYANSICQTSDYEKHIKMAFCFQNCSARKNCSTDQEKLLKFKAESQKFENC